MLKRTTTLLAFVVVAAQHPGAGRYPDMPPGRPPAVDVPDAVAAAAADMRPYRERIVGVGDGSGADGGELALDMTPIPGGEFLLGSPEEEPGRGELESPRRRVRVGPFWMATHETTWDLYRVFMFDTDRGGEEPGAAWADAVSRPTPPYRPMDFGMGVEGFPAISMTQFAARHFTKWLSMKTGRFYRLPTEAEWEYACRGGAGAGAGVSASGGAGADEDGARQGADEDGGASAGADGGEGEGGKGAAADAPWSFGDDPAEIDRFAWHAGNSDRRYREVGQLEPNAWGLFDMHGNVAEWTLDAYASYAELGEGDLLLDPVAWPEKEYPRSVRGGSWRDEPAALRCAARRGSELGWKRMDPQLPQSVWYHTNARFLGFRVVRPLVEPPVEEQERYWAPDVASVRRIVERQRRGERD